MNVLHKLFFDLNITWVKVIVLAMVSGVVTGLILMAPFLDGVFIRNIGIHVEMWVLLAMVISTNCKKPLEAACKVFVFFLISQPLVYLVQWPAYQGFPWHYYSYWFYLTLATPFCALIAWRVRKGDWLSAVALSAPCGLLAGLAMYFAFQSIQDPLLYAGSAVFCLAQIAVYVAVLLPGWKKRLVPCAVSALCLGAYLVVLLTAVVPTTYNLGDPGDYSVSVGDESVVTASISAADAMEITPVKPGSTTITVTDGKGESFVIDVTVDDRMELETRHRD